MTASDELTETLRDAQRFGFFGDRPIEDAIVHATQFVDAIGEVDAGTRLIDLGSGGGLPGLVLAESIPHASIVLLDRRQKRTDFLARAVRRLGFNHVDVWCRDAGELVGAIAAGEVEPFAVATARGFGPPEHTLRIAWACVDGPGRVVISEPPTGDRWPASLLAELGVMARRAGGVRVFGRSTDRRDRPADVSRETSR